MIAIKYALFAVFATCLNIFAQYLSLSFYEGIADLYVAMFFGTSVGLVSKYILDKKYIFYHRPKSKIDDVGKFVGYTLTGVLTTGIFWGFEIGFDVFFEAESAKYMGAIIGLSIGYVLKFFLDKKYIFDKRTATVE